MPAMKVLSAILCLVVLVVMAICGASYAQPPPPYNDRCRWHCNAYHCDYYQNYCDYDCYEVCLGPYRSASDGFKSLAKVGRAQRDGEVPTGKTIKMRIDNQKAEYVQNGRSIRTRTGEAFAITQNCLSSQIPLQ